MTNKIISLISRLNLKEEYFDHHSNLHGINHTYWVMTGLPKILKNTLVFADVIMIGLSLFIGVRNPMLDYIFTVSIGVLAYTIYLVIDDLDSPFRPGAWHLAPDDYKALLEKMKKNGPASCPSLPAAGAL